LVVITTLTTRLQELITACSELSKLRKVLFVALSVTFLFVYEIPREPLNGFAPNSQGRRVWSLAHKVVNVKVKGQRSKVKGEGDHRQKRGFLRIFWELLNGFAPISHGRHVWSLAWTSLKVKVDFGGLRAIYVWKTSLL